MISKKSIYDAFDFFRGVIVRMCVKTLTCEHVTVDLSTEMSLSKSPVQQGRLKEKETCQRSPDNVI